jgi:CheY-like chemotaxis protein
MMDDLVTILRRTLGSHIAVDLTTNCDEPYVFADATLFHTALYNLAINARDAMLSGGKLTFIVNCERGRIGEQAETDVVTIAVKDSGTGMPAEIVGQVFDPFFTTKEPGKGTGLGLSMVYGFVTEAKGDIRVESRPNEGTAFILRFPAVPSPPKAASAANEDVKSVRPGLRMLLVEDDDDLRDATAIQLRRLGVAVQSTASTRETLAMLDADTDFDLLLTDFRLSEPTNGAQLAHEVNARVPGISVIVMSGYISKEDAGVLDPRWTLLEKPLSREDLGRVLQRVEKRIGRNEGRISAQVTAAP